jgi:hypothetical protein
MGKMMRSVWGCLAGVALVLAAGCGGSDDDATPAAGVSTLSCDTTAYVAGAVEAPTAAQVAAYSGTYTGDEGSFDMAGAFTKSGSATLVIANDGALTYKGLSYTPTSVCIEKVAGGLGTIMYFIAGKGHLDVADKVDATLGQAWGVSLADGTTIFTNARK